MFDHTTLTPPPTADQLSAEETCKNAREALDEITKEMADCQVLLNHPDFNRDDLHALELHIHEIESNAQSALDAFRTFSSIRRNTISSFGKEDVHFVRTSLTKAQQDVESILEAIMGIEAVSNISRDNADQKKLHRLEFGFEKVRDTLVLLSEEYKVLAEYIENSTEQQCEKRLRTEYFSLFRSVLEVALDSNFERVSDTVIRSADIFKGIQMRFETPLQKIVAGCSSEEKLIARQKEIVDYMAEIIPDFSDKAFNDWSSFAYNIHKRRLDYKDVNRLFMGLSAWQFINQMRAEGTHSKKKVGRHAEDFLDSISLPDFRKSFAECLAKKNSKMKNVRFAACYLISLLGNTYYGKIPSFFKHLTRHFGQVVNCDLRTLQRNINAVVDLLNKYGNKTTLMCSTKIENLFNQAKEAILSIQNYFSKNNISYSRVSFN